MRFKIRNNVTLIPLVVLSLFFEFVLAQNAISVKKSFKIHTVAFYNLENLFDTINDITKFDEKSPIMEIDRHRGEVYFKKINNMARVMADIGKDITSNTPAIIGVCEVENRAILVDLLNHPLLVSKNYGIIHFESPDARGIDVALLYQKNLFRPISESSHEVKIYNVNTGKRKHTRNQLLVSGKLDGELIHVIVNHWPSRSGGEAKSRPSRIAAAKVNKHLIDSLQVIDPYAKVLLMGDFNDNPNNKSIKSVLKSKANRKNIGLKGIYNPYEKMFVKDGFGTTAYRDSWSLFDQIMVSQPLVIKDDYSSFRLYRAGIYNKLYLVEKRGRWKGYPKRSFSDGGFSDGFSDHFPVYVYLIREAKEQ